MGAHLEAAERLLRTTRRPSLVLMAATGMWVANDSFADKVATGLLDPFVPLPGEVMWGPSWEDVQPIVEALLQSDDAEDQHDILVDRVVNGRLQRHCFTCSFARIARAAAGFDGLHVVCLESTREFNTRMRLLLQQELFEALRLASEPREAIRQMAETLGLRWGVSTVGFAEASPDGGEITVETQWTDGTSAGFAGTYALDRMGPWGEALRAGRRRIVDDLDGITGLDARFRAVLEAGGARSLVAVPLVESGRLKAVLFLTDRMPRSWTDADLALLEDSLRRSRELLVRLQAESEARAVKERLDRIEADGGLGVFDWDIPADREYRSAGMLRLLGLEPDSVPDPEDQGPLLGQIHPDDRQPMLEAAEAALANQAHFTHAYRVVLPDGGTRWLESEARIVRAADGAPLRMTGIVRDVSARRELLAVAEAAERRQQFLTTLGDRLRLPVDPLDVMSAAAETLAEYFRVARVGFSEVSEDGLFMVSRRELTLPTRVMEGPIPLDQFGEDAAQMLRRGETVVIDDVRTHLLTREVAAAWLKLGLGAMVSVPIMKGGRLVAIFDVNDAERHAWTTEEIAATEIVAERTAAAAERARAEEALRENERLLRAIGDASTDLIFAKDAAGRLLYANPATLGLIRRPPEVAIGGAQRDFTPDRAEAEQILANDLKVMETGEVLVFEEAFTADDGSRRLFLSTKAPLRDPNGVVIGLAGVSHDVTELRQAEAALVDSEFRFRLLAENIPLPCWMADAHGRPFWFNSRWYTATGTTEADDPSFPIRPDAEHAVEERWRHSIETGELFSMVTPIRVADGSYRDFLTQMAPVRDAEGRIVRWFGTNTDVTELEALRQTEALHDLILESATDFAIITMDGVGRITSWNTGAEIMFARPAAEVIGEPMDSLFPQEEVVAGLPAATRERAWHDGRAAHEGLVVAADGRRMWASGVTMPLRNPAGEQIGFLAIVRDQTRERRQEEHRRLLADELNHRVRNTLAIVQGLAHQTFRKDEASVGARQAFGQRLTALASAHGLLTRESWEAADLQDIVAETLRTHDPEGGRIIVSGPSARLDPQTSVTVAMMLHELVTNAGKYGSLSVPGGRVALNWAVEGGRLRLHWQEEGGPEVAPPSRRGFGSQLLDRAFSPDSGNSAVLTFPVAGAQSTITVRLAQQSGPGGSVPARETALLSDEAR